MPGGGELWLVAYGNQNRILSGNPQQTFFYKVFKRYTHFSQESITIPLDGPNELLMDAPIRLRAKIPRHADLLTRMDFVFRIPEIYSKLWELAEQEGQYAPAFRWIHCLGALLIDNLGIYVGGTKVQEFPGEWIAAQATLDLPADKYAKWRTLVGDVPEIHSPEWGVYGRAASYPFQVGEYPHTVEDGSGATVASAPSIPERTLRVPLPFWFSAGTGVALPLVSLQLHEVEVQITLRSLREIYRVMDTATQRDPLRSNHDLVLDPAKPTSNDPTTPTTYDNLTLQDGYVTAVTLPCNTPRSYYTDVGQAIPGQDGFVMNAHLEGQYVYLTEKERLMFAERELQALVHQVQVFRSYGHTTRSKMDMDVHGLVSRIVFWARRSDAIEARNDYLNLSNWKSLSQAPYWPNAPPAPVPNSGRLVANSQRDILRHVRLIIAGNELQEEKPAEFYETAVAYATVTGAGAAGLNPGSAMKPEDVMGPLYQIPFAMNGSDREQPSGSLNTSRLREIQLELEPWPLPTDSTYTYDFTVICETLNMVNFQNGMAGLVYAI
jgi:hypothetical protein